MHIFEGFLRTLIVAALVWVGALIVDVNTSGGQALAGCISGGVMQYCTAPQSNMLCSGNTGSGSAPASVYPYECVLGATKSNPAYVAPTNRNAAIAGSLLGVLTNAIGNAIQNGQADQARQQMLQDQQNEQAALQQFQQAKEEAERQEQERIARQKAIDADNQMRANAPDPFSQTASNNSNDDPFAAAQANEACPRDQGGTTINGDGTTTCYPDDISLSKCAPGPGTYTNADGQLVCYRDHPGPIASRYSGSSNSQPPLQSALATCKVHGGSDDDCSAQAMQQCQAQGQTASVCGKSVLAAMRAGNSANTAQANPTASPGCFDFQNGKGGCGDVINLATGKPAFVQTSDPNHWTSNPASADDPFAQAQSNYGKPSGP